MSEEKVAEIKRMISYLRDLDEIREIHKHVQERVKIVSTRMADKSRAKKIAHLRGLEQGTEVLIISGQHRGTPATILRHGRKYLHLQFADDPKHYWPIHYLSVMHPFEEDEEKRQKEMSGLDHLVNSFFSAAQQ